jgi:hypothetical protein
MNLTKYIVSFSVFMLWILILNPVFALEVKSLTSQNTDFSLERKISSSISSLNDIGIHLNELPLSLNKASLMKEYDRLLEVIRILGPDFSDSISFRSEEGKAYSITGMRVRENYWGNLTVGRSINLISEEIYRLDFPLSKEVELQFLAKDLISGIYHPLEPISLGQYCILYMQYKSK